MLGSRIARIGAVGVLLFACLLARGAFARPVARAATNVMDMAYPCGLTNPAFCDNFSEGPAPVKGRGNDLDYRKWSFSRNDAGATGGGAIWAYYPTTAQH